MSADNSVKDPVVSCGNCEACCCRLEVLLLEGDDIPDQLTGFDGWARSVMRRLSDGWCAALDRNTLRCTIYPRRPQLCREYAMGGYDCLDQRAMLGRVTELPGVG